MENIYDQLKTITKEENILINEPMSKHTTFKTGGKADFFVVPESVDEIRKILAITKDVVILGNGSNVLVTDKGIRGVVISLKNLNQYQIDHDVIAADSGISVAKLSHIAAENSLSGLEFACGIPGTLGGAVFMNAGAYGGEMKDVVVSSTYIDKNTLEIKTLQDHQFKYRGSAYSEGLDGIILHVKLKMLPGKKEEILAKMNENMQSRNAKQPVNRPCAGSTFKRQEGVIAAKLIDEAGLKGYKIGGAEVSTLHAGFVINSGNATSKDILDLIAYIKQKIKKEYNVELEPEIKIIGEL